MILLTRLYNLPKGLILVSVLLFSSLTILPKPVPQPRTDYIAPPTIIKNLSAGLNVQLSDSFWLRAIQDFDYCDQLINEKECKGKSWLYQVLDLTTDLDQRFFHAFHWGALALTVIISDYAGATAIFDKGTALYPDEWLLNYSAGYHALFEEKNKTKAAKLYLQAANHGAPDWVRLMAGRLAAEGGASEFAEKILQQMIEMSDEPRYVERLKKKMAELQRAK